ncbi:MAG: hypothetical protein H7318_20140 [Oligoflexus sp.]|nr:hypothetical protein [Oligoflexus sp.]
MHLIGLAISFAFFVVLVVGVIVIIALGALPFDKTLFQALHETISRRARSGGDDHDHPNGKAKGYGKG